MEKTVKIYDLAKILECDARKNELMSKHTTFKIGGAASAYIKISNLSRLSSILKECRDSQIDYILLGNGSNVLVPDEGLDKVVLKLDGSFKQISLIDDTTISASMISEITPDVLRRFVSNISINSNGEVEDIDFNFD